MVYMTEKLFTKSKIAFIYCWWMMVNLSIILVILATTIYATMEVLLFKTEYICYGATLETVLSLLLLFKNYKFAYKSKFLWIAPVHKLYWRLLPHSTFLIKTIAVVCRISFGSLDYLEVQRICLKSSYAILGCFLYRLIVVYSTSTVSWSHTF